MDVRLINPFIAATKKVFHVMARCPVIVQRSHATRRLPRLRDHVHAVIDMSGGAEGAVVVRVAKNLVVPLARGFNDQAASYADGIDALGELANLITGNAKRAISHDLVTISVPEIVEDDAAMAEFSKLAPWLMVPFRAECGTFTLAVSFRTCESAAPEHPAETAPAAPS